jgi:uncharacterized protein YjdB
MVLYIRNNLFSGIMKKLYLAVVAMFISIASFAQVGPITGTLVVCENDSVTLSSTPPGGVWSSANPLIASVGSSSGVVTGVSAGVVTITYTDGSLGDATADVTVNPTPVLSCTSCAVCAGDSILISATITGGTWSSSTPGVGTVDPVTGMVAGISGGTTTITYSLPTGCFATSEVTVNPSPMLSCGTSGMCALCADDSILISATITGGTWSSSTPSVGTVDPVTGMVAGISGGVTTISYTLPTGCYATSEVTVNPAPTLFCVTGCSYCAGGTGCNVGLSGSQVGIMYSLYNGITLMAGPIAGTGSPLSFGLQTVPGTYTVTAFYPSTGCRNTTTCNDSVVINPNPVISGTGTTTGVHVCIGTAMPLTASITGGVWSSANTGIATVGSASGIVSGVTVGVTTITYTLSSTGCYGTIAVTVNPVPVISGTLSLCIGNTTVLAGTPGGGTWSSVGTVASITGTGVATGLAAGTQLVTYVSPAGCVTTGIVTVNPSPVVTGGTTICVSSTTLLTGTPSGGTWSSSNPAIALVGTSSGIVTGITSGTAIITYTLLTGCYTTVTMNVITTPAPISCASGGSILCQVCVLGTMTLTNATPGGVWSSSNPAAATIGSSTGLVTGVAVGVTTITYSLGGGCFVTASLTVNPLPAPISGPNNVCTGFGVTLSSASPGGTWTSTGMAASVGPTTGIVTGLLVGVEIITYTLPTGCYTTYTVTVIPMPCPALDVNGQLIRAEVELFPNPAHEEITISMNGSSYNSVTITNNIGQVVAQKQISKGLNTVDIKSLPAAIYYITFRGDNGITVKRFVKD